MALANSSFRQNTRNQKPKTDTELHVTCNINLTPIAKLRTGEDI